MQPNLPQSILVWRGLKFLQIKDHLFLKKELMRFFPNNQDYGMITGSFAQMCLLIGISFFVDLLFLLSHKWFSDNNLKNIMKEKNLVNW